MIRKKGVYYLMKQLSKIEIENQLNVILSAKN